KPLISASAIGLDGYVAGFCSSEPCTRAIFRDPPGAGATCAGVGVLGPIDGMSWWSEAGIAFGILSGLTPVPLGMMIRMDAAMRFSQFRFDQAPEGSGPRFIALQDLRPRDLVIDLQTSDEAPIPATPDCLRMPEYGATGPLPDADGRVVIACRSGLRAWRAAHRLAGRWQGEVALLALQP